MLTGLQRWCRIGCRALLQKRLLRLTANVQCFPRTMVALETTNYGSDGDLRINSCRRVPTIKYPEQVLVHVQAASLNPIDHRIRTGYGQRMYDEQRLLNHLHHTGYELPLVLGRDCAGVVVAVGHAVQSVKEGDQVWGWTPDWAPGCICEFALLHDNQVRRKPSSLSFIEAASIPYVGVVLLTMFRHILRYKPSDWKGKRVLIHGGGGGIGTLAVQILKAWGAFVTVTSLSRAEELLLGLGADEVLYFRGKLLVQSLAERVPYDVVIDTPGTGDFILYSTARRGKYISMQSSLAELIEDFGRPGVLKFYREYLRKKFSQTWSNRRKYFLWNAFAMSSVTTRHPELLDELGDLVNDHGIVGVVQNIFSLEHAAQAFALLGSGHSQGKTVVSTVPLKMLQSLPEGKRAKLLEAGRWSAMSELFEEEDQVAETRNEETADEIFNQSNSEESGEDATNSNKPHATVEDIQPASSEELASKEAPQQHKEKQ